MRTQPWVVYEVNSANWQEFFSPDAHTQEGVVGWYYRCLGADAPEGPFDTERGARKARDADLLEYEALNTTSKQ